MPTFWLQAARVFRLCAAALGLAAQIQHLSAARKVLAQSPCLLPFAARKRTVAEPLAPITVHDKGCDVRPADFPD